MKNQGASRTSFHSNQVAKQRPSNLKYFEKGDFWLKGPQKRAKQPKSPVKSFIVYRSINILCRMEYGGHFYHLLFKKKKIMQISLF